MNKQLAPLAIRQIQFHVNSPRINRMVGPVRLHCVDRLCKGVKRSRGRNGFEDRAVLIGDDDFCYVGPLQGAEKSLVFSSGSFELPVA